MTMEPAACMSNPTVQVFVVVAACTFISLKNLATLLYHNSFPCAFNSQLTVVVRSTKLFYVSV